MPGHYEETKIKYNKLKKEDPRAFNTAVDMQVEEDMERKGSSSDATRNKLIKKYEKNPEKIDEKWYMATFRVYKSKDFSDYINYPDSEKREWEDENSPNYVPEDERDDLELEALNDMGTASMEQAERDAEGKNMPPHEQQELADEYFSNPSTMDDDILEDNALVRAEDGGIYSEEEMARYRLRPHKMFGKKKKESYLDQADKSEMKTMGPGKGWHGERMRHRDAAMGRRN